MFLINVYLVVAKRLVYHMEFLSESDLDEKYIYYFLWLILKLQVHLVFSIGRGGVNHPLKFMVLFPCCHHLFGVCQGILSVCKEYDRCVIIPS